MLQKGFFMTEPFNPYPYWDGDVFFESNTAGTYSISLPHSAKCGMICVGAGGGGAATEWALPGSNWYYICATGGSGGYSVLSEFIINPEDNISIIVGNGGVGAQGHNVMASAGAGGTSKIIINNSDILVATGGGGAISSNQQGQATGGAGGNGSKLNGNNGSVRQVTANQTILGGASVFGGYGKGGDAISGNNGSGSVGVTGGAGYVKIFAIMPS